MNQREKGEKSSYLQEHEEHQVDGRDRSTVWSGGRKGKDEKGRETKREEVKENKGQVGTQLGLEGQRQTELSLQVGPRPSFSPQ